MTLFEVSQKSFSGDVGTKNPGFYQRYDEFFKANNFKPTGILEIGVHQGESTKVFATVYPDVKILAFDLKLYPDLGFSAFPNITYVQGSQTDRQRLVELIESEFPSGFDLVIEDASHIGAYSYSTFHSVFPYLKPRGVYIIEDWGTGYFDDFVDGSRFQEFPPTWHDGHIPRRLPSHDFGMVGFVKSLVDLTSEPDIRAKHSDPPKHRSRIEKLEFSAAICIALKAPAAEPENPAPPTLVDTALPAATEKAVVTATTETEYEFSHDWFSMRIPLFEKHVLPLSDSPCRLLEIGAYEGRTTTWLTDHVLTHPEARLDSLDLHIQDRLRRNIEKTGREPQITLYAGKSRDILRRLPLGAYDFIYVDGSHSTVDVLEDAVLAFRLAKPGAIIAFDDYAWDEPPWNLYGVPRPAIDAFLAIYAHPSRYEPLVEVLEVDWQVWVRKLADDRRSG